MQTIDLSHSNYETGLPSPPLTLGKLERIYHLYNRRELISPDPLEFVYRFDVSREREIAGFIASSLAFGNVPQINKTLAALFERIGKSPYSLVCSASRRELTSLFHGIKHRFISGEEIGLLLFGIGRVVKEHGSLGNCFLKYYSNDDGNVLPALMGFVAEMKKLTNRDLGFLVPDPKGGSACKRLNLFLRWMVRNDNVDVGCWSGIPPSALIVPLDVHMHRIGIEFSLTKRKDCSMKTAIEITEGFRKFSPDPVKYDFCLTKLSMLKKKSSQFS
ncbi:MAG: TIGR02757 family protein [Actinomycetota bacterium]|nr:TIGR02757 family protein [Actinomycetota bacterium]